MSNMNKAFSLPAEIPGCGAIKIHGFGACMIAGAPYAFEDSFFFLAAHRIRARTGMEIHAAVTSLSGFPCHKAARHVKRALDGNPEILLVQLGSTDLTTNLSRHIKNLLRRGQPNSPSQKSKSSSGSKSLSNEAPALQGLGPCKISLLRRGIDRIKLVLCRALGVVPIHGDESVYIPAIESIIEAAAVHGTLPVILSPFPHGDPVSNSWAEKYSRLLKDLCARKGAIFVDTFHGLEDTPRYELLLSDRLHLSRLGHQKVAALIDETLAHRSAQMAAA